MATVSPCVADTDCIALGLNGSNLEATLITAPDRGLDCFGDGAGIVLDPDPCNSLSLTSAGLLAPPVANSRLLTASVSSTNGATGVTDRSDGTGLKVDIDSFYGAYGSTQTAVTALAQQTITNTSCYTWNIEVGWSMGEVDIQIHNGWTVVAGYYAILTSPHLNVNTQPNVLFDLKGNPLVNNSAHMAVQYPTTDHFVQTYLDPGEVATASVQLFVWITRLGQPDDANCNDAGIESCNEANLYRGGTVRLYAWSRE